MWIPCANFIKISFGFFETCFFHFPQEFWKLDGWKRPKWVSTQEYDSPYKTTQSLKKSQTFTCAWFRGCMSGNTPDMECLWPHRWGPWFIWDLQSTSMPARTDSEKNPRLVNTWNPSKVPQSESWTGKSFAWYDTMTCIYRCMTELHRVFVYHYILILCNVQIYGMKYEI